MQRLQLEQKLIQKLSRQQIQFIQLLQVPTMALHAYITKEIAYNPLLEEEKLHEEPALSSSEEEALHRIDPYPTKNYKLEERPTRDTWTPATISLQENLKEQLHLLPLREADYLIGEHLIGSLDQDGYLSCDLEVIVQDLHIMHYRAFSLQEVEQVLKAIQHLDPPGIAARNLQECLHIQLQNQDPNNPVVVLARRIISQCFDAFTKKHYEIIIKKLEITDKEALKDALTHITRLNPRPSWSYHDMDPSNHVLSPDFVIIEKKGKLGVELTYCPTYKPRLNKTYLKMFEEKKNKQDKASQEMVAFLKKKLEDAKWFMEALSQRSRTLLKTMEAILELQYTFFAEEEEITKLNPMILQHVADKIGMDTSTISRIVNHKSVQGRFGIYPLKFFFSEGISNKDGEAISNKAIKNRILEVIHSEDKQKPYPDEAISELLMKEGYPLARRTVAKYREQLQIPVARLRKALV